MSEKFEYVVLNKESFYDTVKGCFDHQELEHRLNELGAGGYRIIKVISNPGGEDWMIIMSKSSAYSKNRQQNRRFDRRG